MDFSSFSYFLVINRQFVRSCLNHQNKEPEKRTIMKNEQFFIKEIKATFNLRKPKSNAPTNIYLVVRIQNKQTKLATGVKVYPSHWDNQKHEAIISRRYTELDNMNNEIVNNRIEELKTRFNDFKHYLCSHPELTSEIHTIIKEHIYKGEMEQKKDNALLWFDKEIEAPDKNIAPDTKYGYHQKLKRLEEYVNTLDVDYLTFDMVNEKLVSDFQKWMFEPYDDEGNIRSTRTVHNTIVGIKTILCWAKEYISKEDYNDIKDFKPVKVKKEKTKIVLTDKEILQLYKVELEGTEKAIRDVFIFQCEIGQRFEDISELVNGKYDETEKTYTIVQKKTRQSVTIPLTDVALEILSNYDFKLPEYSLVYSNKILKAVADKAGLHREELITKEEKGKIITIKEPIYKHLSSHCARRSFVTNWLKSGLDSNIIKGVTGHRTDEAFQRYNKITSKDAATVMQRARQAVATFDSSSMPNVTGNVTSDIIIELLDKRLAEALAPLNKKLEDVKEVTDHIKANKETIKEENVDMITGMVISLLKDDTPLFAINNMLDTTGLLYSSTHMKYSPKTLSLIPTLLASFQILSTDIDTFLPFLSIKLLYFFPFKSVCATPI